MKAEEQGSGLRRPDLLVGGGKNAAVACRVPEGNVLDCRLRGKKFIGGGITF